MDEQPTIVFDIFVEPFVYNLPWTFVYEAYSYNWFNMQVNVQQVLLSLFLLW